MEGFGKFGLIPHPRPVGGSFTTEGFGVGVESLVGGAVEEE